MDELEKRARAMGGWQALARSLEVELARRRSTKKVANRTGRPLKFYNYLTIMGSLPFPLRGGNRSIAAFTKTHKKKLQALFEVEGQRTLENEISRLRKRYLPVVDDGARMTPEQLEEAMQDLL